MTHRDLVVIGASAGGVEALQALVRGLPADLPAAVLIVQHLLPGGPSVLPQILSRVSAMPCAVAREGDALVEGHILVAPPDRHLVVWGDHVTLSGAARDNGHRPAVDVLFRSAARARGPRVVAVVLSGALDDGTAGMVAVRACGGIGVVQDPEEATHPSMPLHALEGALPEHVASLAALPALLGELAAVEVDDGWPGRGDPVPGEVVPVDGPPGAEDPPSGRLDALACPECGGSLYRTEGGDAVRFRCRVGHAWSPQTLAAQQYVELEAALWMALRSLEEKAALALRMAESAQLRGSSAIAARYTGASTEAAEASSIIRRLIGQTGGRDATTTSDAP